MIAGRMSDMQTTILQALQQPVVACTADGQFIWANYAAESFFGMSSNVMLRQKLGSFISPDSPIVTLLDLVSTRRAPMTEHRVRVGTSRMGIEKIVDAYASPIPEMDGAVALMFQERSIADQIDRQLVSRGAVRSVTGLATMLAHEIKNPLSGIRGAAQLLEQTAADDEIQLTRLIRDETDRIVKMLDRVEIFGDERPVDREPTNIHVVLDRVKLIATNGVAQSMTISEVYDPSLPPVYGNGDQLIQVLLNLLKNAAEALEKTNKPEIRISTAFRPGIKISVPGSAERISLPLEISIEDNGPGISPDILPFLFDPFVTTKPSGSGLGLALVAKIVEDHGGVIECDSEPGRTKFRILLPIAERDAQSKGGLEQAGAQ